MTDTPTAGTTYIVLHRDNSGYWNESGTIQAASTEQAVRKGAATVQDAAVFVAVPIRSWKPVKVITTTKTVTKLEDV